MKADIRRPTLSLRVKADSFASYSTFNHPFLKDLSKQDHKREKENQFEQNKQKLHGFCFHTEMTPLAISILHEKESI